MKTFKVGDKVTYFCAGRREKGIVKRVVDDKTVKVVYHCAEEWDKYEHYTAASTPVSNLLKGWAG
jgi:hypothetical protein